MAVRLGLSGVTRRNLALIVVGVVLAAVAATVAWRSLRPAPVRAPHFVEVAANTYVLPKPDALAVFRLVRHDETPFSNESLQGRWSFLIFGYVSCPDFCPTALAMFNEVHALLAQRPEGTRDVQFVLVSVDPERDTTKLLAEYVPQFNREFIGVTGDAQVIARLAESVGAVYAKVAGSSPGNYMVDHSTAALLINPQGQLQGIFAPPHVAQDVVLGFRKIRAHAAAAVARAGPGANAPALTLSGR